MRGAAKRSVGTDLARAVRVATANIGTFRGKIIVDLLGCEDWASLTFTGARHRLRIRMEGQGAVGAAADFLAAMGDLDLPVRGHIVADLALLAEERLDGGAYAALELEALTVADG